MAWKIFDLLPRLMKTEESVFGPVSRYLERDSEGAGSKADRAFRLCRQVATLYDSYQAYRPEMIIQWQEGRLPDENSRWQGVLWLAL